MLAFCEKRAVAYYHYFKLPYFHYTSLKSQYPRNTFSLSVEISRAQLQQRLYRGHGPLNTLLRQVSEQYMQSFSSESEGESTAWNACFGEQSLACLDCYSFAC